MSKKQSLRIQISFKERIDDIEIYNWIEDKSSVIGVSGFIKSVLKEAMDKEVSSWQNQKYELEIKAAKNETQLDAYKEKLWEDFEVSYIQAMEFKKDDFDAAAAGKENKKYNIEIKEKSAMAE